MNRYRAGGPSKASATTLCQKCLKRGHYTYECSAAQQERPYVSRPSRSQQLLNPKLAPKLSATMLEPEPDTKTSIKSNKDLPSGGLTIEPDLSKRRPRRTSSSHSSDSVSTISTNRSRSRSDSRSLSRSRSRSRSLSRSRSSRRNDRSSRAQPESRERQVDRRRRDSSTDRPQQRSRPSRRNDSDDESEIIQSRPSRARSPRRQRGRSASPERSAPARDISSRRRRSRSRSPFRPVQVRSEVQDDRKNGNDRNGRERSLSPYSQRIAMTRAMNQS